MVMGIFGGWLAGSLSGLFSGADYIIGIQTDFNPFFIAVKDELDEKGEPLKTENPGGKLYLLDHDLAVRSRLT